MSNQPTSLYDTIESEMRGVSQYQRVGKERKPGEPKAPKKQDTEAPDEAQDEDAEPEASVTKLAAPKPATKSATRVVPEDNIDESVAVILHGKWGKARMNAVEVIGSTKHENGLMHVLVRPSAIAYYPAFVVDGEVVKITIEFPDDNRDNEDVVCLGDPVRLKSLGLDIITYVPYALFGMEKDGSINDSTPPDDDGSKDEDVTITKAAAQDFDKPRK